MDVYVLDGSVSLYTSCQSSVMNNSNNSSSNRRRRRRGAREECAQLRSKLFTSDQVDVEIIGKNKTRHSGQNHVVEIQGFAISRDKCQPRNGRRSTK